MADQPGGCRKIRARERYEGKQGLDFLSGISAESVGARALCMHLTTIPAGGRGRAHRHEAHETAIYVLTGAVVAWYGPRLEHRLDAVAGDMLYIPAGEPHLPVNPSATQPVTVVLARTDPNEQESVVLMPELDDLPHTRGD